MENQNQEEYDKTSNKGPIQTNIGNKNIGIDLMKKWVKLRFCWES